MEWWQSADTSTMDATEYSYFVDSMTADEYARYIDID